MLSTFERCLPETEIGCFITLYGQSIQSAAT